MIIAPFFGFFKVFWKNIIIFGYKQSSIALEEKAYLIIYLL